MKPESSDCANCENSDVNASSNNTEAKNKPITDASIFGIHLRQSYSPSASCDSGSDERTSNTTTQPQINNIIPERSAPPLIHDMADTPENVNSNTMQEDAPNKNCLSEVKLKSVKLGEFIISHTLNSNIVPSDEIEETLLRCTKELINKHSILFKGMMRRININDDTAYTAFNTAANELFEGDRCIVNWGRIVALYAFGGQLALYCKEKQLHCVERIPAFVGEYAKNVISNFVYQEGGWVSYISFF